CIYCQLKDFEGPPYQIPPCSNAEILVKCRNILDTTLRTSSINNTLDLCSFLTGRTNLFLNLHFPAGLTALLSNKCSPVTPLPKLEAKNRLHSFTIRQLTSH
ncbi:hypothetical protein BgiMline_024489, partial [Biomphalaria glabrata]